MSQNRDERIEQIEREIPTDRVLPCGCRLTYRIDGDERVMTVSPCQPTCTNLGKILDLANELGRPVEQKETP